MLTFVGSQRVELLSTIDLVWSGLLIKLTKTMTILCFSCWPQSEGFRYIFGTTCVTFRQTISNYSRGQVFFTHLVHWSKRLGTPYGGAGLDTNGGQLDNGQ